MIAVRDLTVRFGLGADVVTAVGGIGFDVRAGESFGIVGESGSGKSTVLRALAGLVDDWSGAVSVAGAPLPRRPDRAFRRRVQLVLQDPYASLHPRQTVDRILAEPLAVHGIPDADRRIVDALAAVGLDASFRFRYPHQLSGGQRQRVAVARALLLDPEILLLDEPTSALDVSVQAEVLNLLRKLRRERRMTFVLVSHNLAVVANMCDRVAVMTGGLIVEQLDAPRLAAGTVTHEYTSALLRASAGYDRSHGAHDAAMG
ncbi:MAG: ABC transporter ATP-binding protein [Alphaproteobacteria bacterium]|nr:ABC transporter ATP-binding protein [Alphaproteobacteria bacterium]